MFRPLKEETALFTRACAAVWIAWALITITERIYWAENPGQVYALWIKVRSIQAFNGFWATLILFSVYRRLSNRTGKFSLPINAIGLVVLTYLFSLFLVLINLTVSRFFFGKTTLMVSWDKYLVIAFSKFFIILGLSALFFLIEHWRALRDQQEKTLTAMAIAKDARLQMLRYQLNPHFLFNALNSIRSLVYEDCVKADKMITDLSDFLRYTLAKENDHDVTLEDEISVINNYLDIQRIRLEHKLCAQVSVQKDLLKFKIPGFLIHPLVENAVKYGQQTSRHPLQINIKAYRRKDVLLIEVSNSGSYAAPNKVDGNGTGLKNVRMRLNHFFPDRNSFELREDAGWVHATIQIMMESDQCLN